MNYAKLNAKKVFVRDKMIIGIDIAKKKHFAAIMLPDGRIPCKPFPFFNTGHAFKNFLSTIRHLMKIHEVKEILIAMEPTGHYWEPLAHYLENNGIPMVFVSSLVVKRTREVMELSRNKNDQKDAYHIAQLASEGKFSALIIPRGPYADLRDLVSFRSALVKERSGLKNRIIGILDTRFPEFESSFWDIFVKTPLALLKKYPFPEDIVKLGITKLSRLIKTRSSNRLGMIKAKEIYEMALSSVGVREGLEVGKMQLCALVQRLEELNLQLARVQEKMSGSLKETGLYDYLLSIPGVGVITAAMVIGETGDLSAYRTAKELIKLAGLNLVENQSGNHGGKEKHISRAGRGALRHALFQIALSCVNNNYTLRAFYLKLVNSGMVKMKAMTAAMCKILRIIFAVCRKGEHYVEPEDSYDKVKSLECEMDKYKMQKQIKIAA